MTNKEKKYIIHTYKKRINLREWKPIPLFSFGGGIYLANIEEKVESLIEPKINELGYKLYDVEYKKEGKDYFLRIFIDRENRNRFKGL